jgi:polysaccharide biosynthesis protein PslJ
MALQAADLAAELKQPHEDAWPRTRRPLPWLVAGYMVLLVLIPFDSAQLPISAPVDTTLDRFAIGALVLGMVLLAGAGSRRGPVWNPLGLLGISVATLLLLAGTSDFLNAQRLEYAGETSLAVKRYAYLLGYCVSFALIAWSLHARDTAGLLTFLVVLGVVCALGVIYQYRGGTNVFYDWFRAATGGVLAVDPTPAPRYSYSRPVITGPAEHGLAVATMLLMIAPFALGKALMETSRGRQLLWGSAFLILVLGSSSTLRRTSVLALAALLLVLLVYRPRDMLRLTPLAIPAFIAAQIVAPGVGGNLKQQLLGNNANTQASTEGRTSDYAAVVPDFLDKPLFGRGFGTYYPLEYRVLDNQWLLSLLEIGLVGVLSFAAVLAVSASYGHRLRRSEDPRVAWFGVASIAAVAVFATSCVLFDALSFPQPAYMFMLVSAMLVVVRHARQAPPENAAI